MRVWYMQMWVHVCNTGNPFNYSWMFSFSCHEMSLDSFAKAQEVIYGMQYPNGDGCVRCPCASSQWRLPLQPKESQARQSGKAGDKFSSQLKQLAGLQVSCLYPNSLCICRTLGVWNTHKGLTNMTEDLYPVEPCRGWARCLYWHKKPHEAFKQLLVFLFFFPVKLLTWLLNVIVLQPDHIAFAFFIL